MSSSFRTVNVLSSCAIKVSHVRMIAWSLGMVEIVTLTGTPIVASKHYIALMRLNCNGPYETSLFARYSMLQCLVDFQLDARLNLVFL